MVVLYPVPAEFFRLEPDKRGRSPRRDLVAGSGGAILFDLAMGGAVLLRGPVALDRSFRNLCVSPIAHIPLGLRGQLVHKHVLPSRRSDGGSVAGAAHALKQFRSIQIRATRRDYFSCRRN